ncbi:MAG: methylenetetrahydrofolate reductase [NAD(P)H] [Gracilibacteraceae bacterium]|jgi:methylenetetrahydrofolate reductase (NADPH)|nr:methylenetetrahydrofolate reductase [NAD(P)H] [Gracilibacteraceae bacterium]
MEKIEKVDKMNKVDKVDKVDEVSKIDKIEKIDNIFVEGRAVFSLEVFPPKKDGPIEKIYAALKELRELNPDFISVTYGAGGNPADSTTVDIASFVQAELGVPAVAHLTCVNSTRADVGQYLVRLRERGVLNILALRGDVSPEGERKWDFPYAVDLIRFIREQDGDFHLSAACYPEGHVEAPSPAEDLRRLLAKTEAGAGHLISQLFFDNAIFFDFVRRARAIGVTARIEAGIMPVLNVRQIQRMVSLCGASIPSALAKIMSRWEHDPQALRRAGVAYAAAQIADLLANGAEGIHLYTMNDAAVAREIAALLPARAAKDGGSAR